ncbi:MAG: serine/threonine protein kinase [Planctomycetota bacterium]|jgi:serine/threonine protein kinase
MGDLPKNIGKYQIRSSLGEGAMGVVFEGFDPDIERRVAIKILHPHLVTETNGGEFLERFKREAISAARCTHPNIVMVLEYGQDGEMPFIVMEFVEGATLQEIIKLGNDINLQKILSIISQLLKALHSAHQLKIVHRDIKAANVMILKDGGSVKLADFGIARIAESPDLTMTGAVVGTPKYMAPEQMFGLKVDSRADLFSVSMLFLDLLALLPKSPSIPRSSLPEIVNLPPNNRIDYSILYPTALIPVLVKGLSATQAGRYQSAREFVQGIKDVMPKLKSVNASVSNDATAIVQKSTQSPSTDKDELSSMTNLLVDYIGPIAKNIMFAHDKANTSANELATVISREIPKVEEREEFLKRWEVFSGTQISNSETQTSTNDVRSFDDHMLKEIAEDYAGYIGPLAGRLVRYHATTTRSLQQLLESLASEIPEVKDSEKFKKHWLRG